MTEYRQPPREEISQEKTLFWVLSIDGVDAIIVVAVAIATGSLTLLADASRALLTLMVGYFSLWILYRKHRNRLEWFDFGSGKLERMVWCIFGLTMIIGALLIFGQVINVLLNEVGRPTPLDRSIAAITRSSNLLINTIGWFSILFLLRKRHSDVFLAQFHARSMMMGCSIVVQITLTFSALSQTVMAGLIWDVVGTIFVTGLMLYSGWKMIARGLPDLLDAPAPEIDVGPVKSLIRRTFSKSEIQAIRSRRSADTIFVEVTLSQEEVAQRGSISQRVEELEKKLGQIKGNFDVTLVAQSAEDGR